MYALSAALSRNPAKAAVVAVAVLGSAGVEVLEIATLVTRGTRAFRRAKTDNCSQRRFNDLRLTKEVVIHLLETIA